MYLLNADNCTTNTWGLCTGLKMDMHQVGKNYQTDAQELCKQSDAIAAKYGLIPLQITQSNLYRQPQLLHQPRSVLQVLGDKGRSLESTLALLSYMNPYTPTKRMALIHSTGTGKTRKALLAALQYDKDIAVVVVHNIQAKPFVTELESDVIRNLYPGFNRRVETVTCSSIMNAHNGQDISRLDYYFKNRVIIVDEVHHVRNRGDSSKAVAPLFETMVAVLATYKDSILMLLTATPLVDDVSELMGLYTLLRGTYPLEGNYDAIAYALTGYLSKLDKRNLRVEDHEVKCIMVQDGEQWRLYQKHQHDRSSVYTNISAVSRFITNDDADASEYSLSAATAISYIMQGVQIADATEYNRLCIEALKSLSVKYYMLIQNLRQHRGHPHFIFDVWKKRGGAERLVEVLTMPAIGYSSVTSEQEALDRTRGLKLLALHKVAAKGNSSVASRLLDIYNSEENRDGSLIDVLIATPKFSESMSVRNAKYKHSLNSFWNIPGKRQVDGRINRRTSLAYEEPSNRYIVSFNYVLYKPNGEPTFEADVIRQADSKYQHIKPVMHIMEDIKLEKLLSLSAASNAIPIASSNAVPSATPVVGSNVAAGPDPVVESSVGSTATATATTAYSCALEARDIQYPLNTRINTAVRMSTPIVNHRNMYMDVNALLQHLEGKDDLFSLIYERIDGANEGYTKLTSVVVQAVERIYLLQLKGEAITNKQRQMLEDVSKAFMQVNGETVHLLYFINEDTVEYQRMSRMSRRVLRVLRNNQWIDEHNTRMIEVANDTYKKIQTDYANTIRDKWMNYGYYITKYTLSACYRLVEYRGQERIAKSSVVNDVDTRKLARGEKWLHYNKNTLTMLLCKLYGYGPREYTTIYKKHKTLHIFLAILNTMGSEGMILCMPV